MANRNLNGSTVFEIRDERLYLNGRAVDRVFFDNEVDSAPLPTYSETTTIEVIINGVRWAPEKQSVTKNLVVGGFIQGNNITIGDING
jgi:trehalose utilization protein